MAGSPSTRAMGQGAAQVFDTSNLAQAYGQGKIMEEQRKAVAQKDFEKKVAELSGAASDIFKEKYFATRDDQYIRGLYKNLMKNMEGKWGKAIDPMSPERRYYNDELQNIYFETQKSQESKELAQPFITEVGKNPTAWRPESREYIKKYIDTPGMIFDPTQMKKINDFDVDTWFQSEVQQPFWKEIEATEQKNIGYNDKGEYTVTGTTTVAPDAKIDERMTLALQNIKSDPKKMEKIEEITGLQGEDALGYFYNQYKDKLKLNKQDYSYSKSGEGKEEPFNPNNIVEDVIVKIGTNKNYDPGWFGPWEKVIANKKTKMYQTVPIQDNVTISKGVIDMGTGKEFDAVGSFPMTMGSPFIYEGKMMVPAYIDKGTEGNVSVLIPAEQVQESFYKKGYDMKQMAQGLGVKNFGGQVIDGTSAKDRMLKLKAGK